MQGLFTSSVQAPWCYLEFGDVAWCEDASRLDPRLHTAGLHEASAELALAAKGGPDPHQRRGVPLPAGQQPRA
jgi:hypothetical protein